MKINWGTGIAIAIVLFISFILYFVIKVQSDSKYDNELVVEEYYKQELTFENKMLKIQNAHDLTEKIIFQKTDDGIKVTFPSNFEEKKIEGKVFLYRPSNQKLDSEMNISLSDSQMLIPKSSLVGGLWDISIEWKYDEKEYLTQETIYF
jgi:nitrogen fixation protein FixH